MLYIPAYLTLPMLRRFASEDTPGSPVVMMRECINTLPSGYKLIGILS